MPQFYRLNDTLKNDVETVGFPIIPCTFLLLKVGKCYWNLILRKREFKFSNKKNLFRLYKTIEMDYLINVIITSNFNCQTAKWKNILLGITYSARHNISSNKDGVRAKRWYTIICPFQLLIFFPSLKFKALFSFRQ